MKSIYFTYAGIDFQVNFHEDENNKCIDEIVDVCAYNKKKSKYEPISCEIEHFEKDFELQIADALQEMYDGEKAYWEDMKYEEMRESKYASKN